MHDREVLSHGIETGIIKRLPSGEFIEVHQPLGPVDSHGHGTLTYGGMPVPKKMNTFGGVGRRMIGFFRPVAELPGPAPKGNGDESRPKELAGTGASESSDN
jgi:ubiquinol-cytochrome c reductase cytochrome b subunit